MNWLDILGLVSECLILYYLVYIATLAVIAGYYLPALYCSLGIIYFVLAIKRRLLD